MQFVWNWTRQLGKLWICWWLMGKNWWTNTSHDDRAWLEKRRRYIQLWQTDPVLLWLIWMSGPVHLWEKKVLAITVLASPGSYSSQRSFCLACQFTSFWDPIRSCKVTWFLYLFIPISKWNSILFVIAWIKMCSNSLHWLSCIKNKNHSPAAWKKDQEERRNLMARSSSNCYIYSFVVR